MLDLGGARAGGKRGRGAPGKTPFVAAVSTSPEGRPRQGQAGPGQGLPQARDRARRQALAGPRKRGPHRRPALLERARRGRRKPSRDPHRLRAAGRPHGALQMGQHDARQHQERDHRNLPQARPRSCPTLPRQLRLAIQPALPAQHHYPALRSQRRTNPTHPIPGAHRWMTFMDRQEREWTPPPPPPFIRVLYTKIPTWRFLCLTLRVKANAPTRLTGEPPGKTVPPACGRVGAVEIYDERCEIYGAYILDAVNGQ